jgi:putative transposase
MDDLPCIESDAVAPQRQVVDIQVGKLVRRGETVYRIVQVLDFGTVVGISNETGRSVSLRVEELRPAEAGTAPIVGDLSDIADEHWTKAEQRFAAIKPLLDVFMPGRSMVGHTVAFRYHHTKTR